MARHESAVTSTRFAAVSGARQLDEEQRPTRCRRLETNGAAHGCDDGAADGEAEPGTTLLAASAPWNMGLSRLNGWPVHASVNASPCTSRHLAHDSRSVGFATPSTVRDLHPLLFAGLPAHLPSPYSQLPTLSTLPSPYFLSGTP
jgi:hypothetical protein